jgi:hypothetical protein
VFGGCERSRDGYDCRCGQEAEGLADAVNPLIFSFFLFFFDSFIDLEQAAVLESHSHKRKCF